MIKSGDESSAEKLSAEGFRKGEALFGMCILLGNEEREAVELVAVVVVGAFVAPGRKLLGLN